MDLKKEIESLLKENNLKPIKYRGQNFLINRKLLKEIVSIANIKAGETVLEIGPGVGNLTEEILAGHANVIAVEKDGGLAGVLEKRFNNKRLKVVNKSILDFNETEIKTSYKIVANIPYYLTGPIIRKFLLSPNSPLILVLTVQKEVAERICAKPPKSNFLSVSTSFLASAQIKKIIKPENFWPKPKVDSAVISIVPNKTLPTKKEREVIVFLKTAFKQPRKTLLNNLLAAGRKREDINKAFKALKLNEKTRAHEISKENWQKLFTLLVNS